jgi:hypothetical protein
MFMKYWVGLYPGDAQEMIKEGVETMLRTAIRILKKTGERQAPRLLIVGWRKEPWWKPECGDKEDIAGRGCRSTWGALVLRILVW